MKIVKAKRKVVCWIEQDKNIALIGFRSLSQNSWCIYCMYGLCLSFLGCDSLYSYGNMEYCLNIVLLNRKCERWYEFGKSKIAIIIILNFKIICSDSLNEICRYKWWSKIKISRNWMEEVIKELHKYIITQYNISWKKLYSLQLSVCSCNYWIER